MSEEKDIEPKISRMIESQRESERNMYLKDEIKSLESRLKEIGIYSEAMENELRSKISDYHDVNEKHKFRIVELEQRLSQAEAEQKRLEHVLGEKCDQVVDLMDVAGKMAGAIEGMNFYLSDQENAMGMDFYSKDGRKKFNVYFNDGINASVDFKSYSKIKKHE